MNFIQKEGNEPQIPDFGKNKSGISEKNELAGTTKKTDSLNNPILPSTEPTTSKKKLSDNRIILIKDNPLPINLILKTDETNNESINEQDLVSYHLEQKENFASLNENSSEEDQLKCFEYIYINIPMK